MSTFPVSLIPTFFVPLFLLLHALTFKRIADVAPPVGHDVIRPAHRQPV
jgi:hypothetical protein